MRFETEMCDSYREAMHYLNSMAPVISWQVMYVDRHGGQYVVYVCKEEL